MLISVSNGVPIFYDMVGGSACPFAKRRALKGSLDKAVAGALRSVHPRCNDLDSRDAIPAWKPLMLGFHPSAINNCVLREKTEADCAERAMLALTHAPAVMPQLWFTEIANALLLGERRKLISAAQSVDFLGRLNNLPITVDDAPVITRQEQVMAFAREYNLTAYDATYFELALRSDAHLASFDKDLLNAQKKAGGKIFH